MSIITRSDIELFIRVVESRGVLSLNWGSPGHSQLPGIQSLSTIFDMKIAMTNRQYKKIDWEWRQSPPLENNGSVVWNPEATPSGFTRATKRTYQELLGTQIENEQKDRT